MLACFARNSPPKENDRPWPEAIGGRAWLSLSISLVFFPKGGICMSFVKVMNKKICLLACLLAFPALQDMHKQMPPMPGSMSYTQPRTFTHF